VRNWKNGDLGITLAGDPTGDGAAEAAGGPNFDVAGPEMSILSPVEAVDFSEEDASAAAWGADASEQLPPITGPGVGEGATPEAFDFDSALASLLGGNSMAIAALDAATVQSAIDAFSGVLEPPDVSFGSAEIAGGASAVTDVDLADALAADVYPSDLESEAAWHVGSPIVPEAIASLTPEPAAVANLYTAQPPRG
jgi:hypothetical protein